MNQKVFVVVVLYNGAKWVERCFGSLRMSKVPLSVIAIDNASTDTGVQDLINDFPEVEVIKAGINLGFGKANNIGIKRALDLGADYVLLLNQDAWIETDTIPELINVHRLNSEYGILSPIHLNGIGNKMDLNFSNYASPSYTDDFLSDLYLGRLKSVYSTSFVNAAAWLVSKECINKVGVFDHLFPHYGEDVDYARRVILAGYNIGIVPGVKVYHDRQNRKSFNMNLDKNRVYVENVLLAKNLNGSFSGNILFLFKKEIDTIFTHFMFGRFKEAMVKIEMLIKVTTKLAKIRVSYLDALGKR